jgi:hypothetical protein
MTALPVRRVVLYKHGVGYFEREGSVENDATLTLTFKQSEVSDVLKSLTVLDLDGGHVASVSYDSTKPLEQLLNEVALSIPDQGSLVGLLPQIKGARLAVQAPGGDAVQGILLGVDTSERHTADGVVRTVLVSLLTDGGDVRSFELHGLQKLEILDPALRRDLEYYLRTLLSAKKKDARTFTFFAQGTGKRGIRLSYTLEAPVWKATYRIILGEEGQPPMVQGWAVVDNTQDEDWEAVQLSLVAGLPVSFVHDLYTPRYIRRPVVEVKETTGVLPPEVEGGMELEALHEFTDTELSEAPRVMRKMRSAAGGRGGYAGGAAAPKSAVSSMSAQVRERKLGDLFEYEIEHPVTIRRNQSALVPIVLRPFEGRPVLLYNKAARAENPMRAVEFKNTTGLTLEGGPVTVLEAGSYVGEAMLDTLKPDEQRLIPYAVELSVGVLDNVNSFDEKVLRVVIRKGTFQSHYAHVDQTTYHFNNKSDAEQVVYLDHPRPSGPWKLFDTPQPHETTENYWRFRFTSAPKKVTDFVVRCRKKLQQDFVLTDLDEPKLMFWLKQGYLDARTEKVLRQAIELKQQAASISEQIQRREAERETIHKEQKRIRENLQALGDRASEKELRERHVRSLNTQEDRLEAIEAEIKGLMKELDQCREELNDLLEKLEYETNVA